MTALGVQRHGRAFGGTNQRRADEALATETGMVVNAGAVHGGVTRKCSFSEVGWWDVVDVGIFK